MSNPFDLLGNDVEDASQVAPIPREVVKKSTSSKKADVPPPSADKSRANKNRPTAAGNEAAFKDKRAGRAANKAKSTAPITPAKKGGKPKSQGENDRKSRGRPDSDKKIKQAGWTDDDAEKELKIEQEAVADVEAQEQAEAEADAAAAEPAKKSLADYLAETSIDEDTPGVSRVIAQIDAEVLVKEKEDFISSKNVKKDKSKAKKEKQTLDFTAVFADSTPKEFKGRNESARGRGKPVRGGKGKSTFKPKAPKTSAAKVVLTDEDFPSL